MARPSGFSPVLLALLAIGLAGGAAASFVASTSYSYATGGSFSSLLLSSNVLAILVALPLVGGFAAILFQRARGGRMPVPGGVLIIVGVLIAGLVLLAILTYTPQHDNAPLGVGPGSSTGTPPAPNNTTPTNNSTQSGSTTATSLLPSLPVPSWLLLVVVGVIALAAIGLGVPAARSIADRRGARAAAAIVDQDRAAATTAFGQALADLDQGTEPRVVVERLYVQLLARLERVTNDVGPRTPEEIRAESLLPLGIRPAAANEITRIFEEARYSSHPIDAAQAARVRSAFQLAWADLSGATAAR